MRWTGLDSAGDTWEPLDNLTNCENAIAAFEQATGRSLPRPAPPPPTGTSVAPPQIPPTGFAVEAAPPGDLGAAMVGRTVLYWWPDRDDGWQRGTVARLCPRSAFSHAVAYRGNRRARHGGRCSTPPPTAPAGCGLSRRRRRRVWPEPFDPGPPNPKFEFGRWLVTAAGPGPAGQRAFV